MALSSLHHMTTLDIYNEPSQQRKTSIICTIGPKTNSVEMLTKLIHAGMNVVRLNFSHGSYEYHQSVIDNAREADKNVPDTILAIALDTKGPEIRTGLLEGDDLSLKIGHVLTLSTNPEYESKGNMERIYVDYKKLPTTMKIGNTIYVDDGLISLEVIEVGEDFVKTSVVNAGKLGSRKGVNLPEVNVELPALSEKDKKDLEFGVKNGVDMIFASFIRKPSDVLEVREALGPNGKHIKIISKIENHEGVQNFDKILEVSDGIMVARGDLGIEIAPQKVFLAQKMMISKCNIAGKPVICATQMLESMTYNPRPTRAEVSDVANAVLDGSDCVMLSGESAKGDYPIEAVTMMANICREAESAIFYGPLFNQLRALNPFPLTVDETIASSAVNSALESNAKAIIVLTTSGRTSQLVSKYRPPCAILTVTRNPHTARCSHLSRGCYPYLYAQNPEEVDWQGDVDSRISDAIAFAKRKGLLKDGDSVIAVQGWRKGSGYTNTLRILSA